MRKNALGNKKCWVKEPGRTEILTVEKKVRPLSYRASTGAPPLNTPVSQAGGEPPPPLFEQPDEACEQKTIGLGDIAFGGILEFLRLERDARSMVKLLKASNK